MLTAARGAIRWKYFEAARLANCTITVGDDQRRHVVGRVETCNATYLEQAPLAFVLFMQGREHTWPVEAISVGPDDHGMVLRAIVGSPGGMDGTLSATHT